jgi:hypothetical protein
MHPHDLSRGYGQAFQGCRYPFFIPLLIVQEKQVPQQAAGKKATRVIKTVFFVSVAFWN